MFIPLIYQTEIYKGFNDFVSNTTKSALELGPRMSQSRFKAFLAPNVVIYKSSVVENSLEIDFT
ncbi:unnamed protein product [marine sediment metagenome]|uniref:Uncharacterized protein n=1 Tax=marine sediment metagenome TaxID=412755 RepID=X0YH48_9ZZZZ